MASVCAKWRNTWKKQINGCRRQCLFSFALSLSPRMQQSNTLVGYFARSKWCLLKARVSEAKRKIINNIIYVCVWVRTCNRRWAVRWDRAYNNICLTELDKRDAVKSRQDTTPSTLGISRFRMELTLLSLNNNNRSARSMCAIAIHDARVN